MNGSVASGGQLSPRRLPSRLLFAATLLLALFASRNGATQQVGHKTPGTVGLNAGTQVDPGIYLVNELVSYRSSQIFDRNGNAVPAGFDLRALAAAFAVSTTVKLPKDGTFYTATIAIPTLHATVDATNPPLSIDRFGYGDLYLQPLKLGWRGSQLDVVTGLALYVPIGNANLGDEQAGAGRSQWGFEPTLGGTIYFDSKKTWTLSALAGYEVASRKLAIDVRRGDVFQVQGGVGKKLFRLIDIGVVGFGLWQVTDHGGSALPPELAGARDRAYALGPEIDLVIPLIRSRLTARYEHDFAVEARPLGQILVFGLTTFAYRFAE